MEWAQIMPKKVYIRKCINPDCGGKKGHSKRFTTVSSKRMYCSEKCRKQRTKKSLTLPVKEYRLPVTIRSKLQHQYFNEAFSNIVNSILSGETKLIDKKDFHGQ